MAEQSFSLSIRCSYPKGEKEFLTFTSLLRTVPGRRDVYEALWNNKSVIAKVFSHRLSAKRHLKREWRGLTLLQKRRLNSPEPIFCGQTEDGRWLVAERKIQDSPNALTVFNESPEHSEKIGILLQICKEIARQHDKGVLQKDFHLENYLLNRNKVYTIDPGQMRFFSRPVSRKRGVSQVAMLACYLPDHDIRSISRLYTEYLTVRAWCAEKSEENFLERQRDFHRKRIARKGLKKTLRTSKRYLKFQSGNFLSVIDRSFCAGADPNDFIREIDALINGGKIFKNGNTCNVSCLNWNGKCVVVKRYNHKGMIHSLRHTIKKSRARRGWLHAQRLTALNIATPKPLAYIEMRRGLLVFQSYLVTECVKGQKFNDFLCDTNVAEARRKKVISQVLDLLNRLWKYQISHGDLKHSNILIGIHGPALIDLDGMTVHHCKYAFKRKHRRDLKRFNM